MRLIPKPGLLLQKRPGRLLILTALVLTTIGLILVIAPPLVQAERPFLSEAKARYPQIEGSKLDDCRLCHKNKEGGGPRNAFGQDFQIHSYDFAVMENLDTDGDGFTNLEEFMALTIPSNPKNFPKEHLEIEPTPVIAAPITLCYINGRPENVPVEPGGLPVFGPELNQVSLFSFWQKPDSDAPSEVKGDAARGQKLFEADLIGSDNAMGCKVCHLTNASGNTLGPPTSGLGRRSAETIQQPDYTGQAKTVEAYLRESLLKPEVYVTPGFATGLMLTNYGEVLTEQEIADLVAYMLTLK
ncbi:MAG: cytochrome c [Anaerolineales bacterium]|nr:cytochrome c [Anaerolineales bacterium]